jgi:predicted RNase H-like HicB family nuclease
MVILVRATWDAEANVWVAESPDLPGLVTEAPSIEALNEKIPGMIQDLLGDENGDLEIPVEVVASFSRRVRIRAHAT